MIVMNVLVFAAVVLQLAACARLLDSRKAETSKTGPQTSLEERDFSAALDLCQARWVDRNTNPDTPPLNWALAGDPVGLGNLPKMQQIQLGGYVAPNGKYVDFGWTLCTIDRFENEFGRRPDSGLEIVQWLSVNTPSFSGEDLGKLSPEAMPPWFFKFVNPQTGKLYKSFDGSIAEPGGVQFRKLIDAADCKRAYGNRDGWQLFSAPGFVGGDEVIVSDSDPSKVLDTAVVLKRVDLKPEAGITNQMTTSEDASHSHPHTR
jgi:hypothetical protein